MPGMPKGSTYAAEHIVILIVFLSLATSAVGLRIWARRIQKVSLALNDYLILAGLLATLTSVVYNIYSCCGIVDTDEAKTPEEIQAAIIQGLKSQFISPLLWVLAVTTIRSSILSLFIHVFRTPIFRTTCLIVFGINLAFFLGTVLADCLICRPVSFRWSLGREKGVCGDQKSLDLFIAVFNLVLDAAVVVLPMPVLWGLKMAVGKKMALTGIFGMGISICAITLYRVYISATLNAHNAATMYPNIALLASLEALLGITNACLPVLKPTFDRLRSSMLLTSLFEKSSRGRSSGPSGKTTLATSGSIPIKLRITRVWERGTGRGMYSSRTDGTGTAVGSEAGWVEMKDGEEGEMRGREEVPSKQERVLGQKVPGVKVMVRKDFDVESARSEV